MEILITGGAGFIGCTLAEALTAGSPLGAGHLITAIDNLHPQVHPDRARPSALPADLTLIVADVCEASTWAQYFSSNRPDVIIHLAAETGTGQSLVESARHARVNVTGVAELVDAMTAVSFRPQHVVLASSRAVYGEGAWRGPGGDMFYPGSRSLARLDNREWNVTTPAGEPATPMPHDARRVFPAPTSVYGATKLAQEHLLSCWCEAMATPLSILRLQNVYGPGQSPSNTYAGIMTLFHRQAAAGKTIDIYEDGQIGRDFVYIDDVCAAFLAVLKNPPERTRTIDVGTGVATTIEAAAQAIAMRYGAPRPIVSGKYRPGDVRWAVSDAEMLLKELDVAAKVSFQEGSDRLGNWLAQKGFVGA